ncbi:uncharacterized protein LOC142342795 [Convolutriloba macropyga]|uniref:uncharacterized protein LOC142342795 n=1 Tax=Convolutriloba macropyga TaxID=536237 RepID=UPI003F520D11
MPTAGSFVYSFYLFMSLMLFNNLGICSGAGSNCTTDVDCNNTCCEDGKCVDECQRSDSTSITTVAIVLIVIGSLILTAVIIGIVACCCNRRRRRMFRGSSGANRDGSSNKCGSKDDSCCASFCEEIIDGCLDDF